MTGVAMCASSVVLWAVAAAVQSHRVRVISDLESRYTDRCPRWYEKLIIHGPLHLPRMLWDEAKIYWYIFKRWPPDLEA